MLFSTVALFLSVAASASASVFSARQASPYPDCANSCILNADLGDCGSNTNLPCLCKAEDFIKSTTTCIEGACKGADLEKALSVSQQICASVGVTLTSSEPASTTATSPGAAATTTPAANATTTGVANATTTGTSTANSTSTGHVNATSTGNSTAAPTASSPSAAGSNAVVFSSFFAVGAAVLALAL